MGGSHSKPDSPSVTVDISRYPGGSGNQGVQGDDGNGYYYEIDSKRINLKKEDYSSGNGQYNKLTHTPDHGKVGKINSKYYVRFTPGPSDVPSVTVFYSLSDPTHETPLIVQFGEGNNYYTTDTVGNFWNIQSSITAHALKQNLDKQNCARSETHVINLSEKRLYNCPRCLTQRISVDSASRSISDYTYYTHSISGAFGEFMDNTKLQTGITSTNISTVYVYLLEWDTPKPLLINIQGSTWYKRKGLDDSSWDVVSTGKPSNLYDSTNISKILLGYYSSSAVTIDLGKTNATSGSGTTYTDPSGGKQIKVTINKLTEGFVSFSHCVDKKDYFIVKNVQYSGSPIPGIDPNSILTSVTAYYYDKGGPDFKLDDLLMIGFEKRNGPKKYVYYGRKSGGPTWTVILRETNELDGNRLTTQLTELKSKLESEKNKSPKGNGLGPGAIAGISIASVSGTGLGALAVWKGPALIARLIARL